MREDREAPEVAPVPVVEWDEEVVVEAVAAEPAEVVQAAAVEAVGQVWETVPAPAPAETASVRHVGRKRRIRQAFPATR